MKIILFAVAIALSVSSFGWADDRSEAQQHFLKGKKAYELGAYDEAVAEYAAAYRLKDDPALLFNLGQAHRLADHPLEALRAYRMFLIRVPDAPNRADVDQKIAEMERRIATDTKKVEPPPPAPLKPVASPAGSPAAPPAVTSSHPGRSKTISGAVLVSGGVALAVGGVVCGVLAKQSSDSLTRLDQTMQPFNSSLERTGKTEQILEGVLIGVGAAAAVAGAALVAIGHRERARRLAFVPSIGPGSVRATLMGSF